MKLIRDSLETRQAYAWRLTVHAAVVEYMIARFGAFWFCYGQRFMLFNRMFEHELEECPIMPEGCIAIRFNVPRKRMRRA